MRLLKDAKKLTCGISVGRKTIPSKASRSLEIDRGDDSKKNCKTKRYKRVQSCNDNDWREAQNERLLEPFDLLILSGYVDPRRSGKSLPSL